MEADRVEKVHSNAKGELPEKLKAARACQRAIGRELRLIYDEVVHEPLPSDLLQLLRGIDTAQPDGPDSVKS